MLKIKYGIVFWGGFYWVDQHKVMCTCEEEENWYSDILKMFEYHVDLVPFTLISLNEIKRCLLPSGKNLICK